MINPKQEGKCESPKYTIEIWTEGKTDIKHLKSALREIRLQGQFTEFNIRFKDDLNPKQQGDNPLLQDCKALSKKKQSELIVAIFDRDNNNILKQVHDEAKGFKDWGNNVYSFAIPIPEHRKDEKEICIELYYKDEGLKRCDENGRRLFLSSEFHPKSGIHSQGKLFYKGRKNPGKALKIIDDEVFDSEHNNVALSKNAFADYILSGEKGFSGVDKSEFQSIFDVVSNILNHSIEKNKR